MGGLCSNANRSQDQTPHSDNRLQRGSSNNTRMNTGPQDNPTSKSASSQPKKVKKDAYGIDLGSQFLKISKQQERSHKIDMVKNAYNESQTNMIIAF